VSDDRHIPVMLDEVVAALKPGGGRADRRRHVRRGRLSRALLERGAHVTGFDQDPTSSATPRRCWPNSKGGWT
jgi:16S rRNA (cytosine1402-N4)-methyltransferase